jgi:hypothetical protein
VRCSRVEFLILEELVHAIDVMDRVAQFDARLAGGRNWSSNIPCRNPSILHLYFPAQGRLADWGLLAQPQQSISRFDPLPGVLSTF